MVTIAYGRSRGFVASIGSSLLNRNFRCSSKVQPLLILCSRHWHFLWQLISLDSGSLWRGSSTWPDSTHFHISAEGTRKFRESADAAELDPLVQEAVGRS